MWSDKVGRQIDDSKNSPRAGITHKVDALAVPVIVEVPPPEGI